MFRIKSSPAPRVASIWLLLTAAATLAPHATHLPPWLTGLCAGLLLWHTALLRGASNRPGRLQRLLIVLIAVAAAAGVRLEYGQLFGQNPGVALLAVLLCLKLLEGGSTRDVMSAILLSFFLQLGLFFYNQTLPVAALASGAALLATATLLALQDPDAGARRHLRTGGVLMLQALPFLLVLFVLFPRVQGPLWGLPDDAHSALSGLSETMTPGSISELTLSGAIVFRARFEDSPPAPAQRYWRGPVLTEFDGHTWRPARPITAETPAYTPAGPSYRYELTLEPHNRHWLLAMDFAGRDIGEDVRYASDYQLLAPNALRSRARYELSAHPETPVGRDERESVLHAATRLPDDSNPRTLALAARLAEGAASPRQVLDRALDHLRVLDLTYTLSPVRREGETIDTFLFETHQGFCEDFAAAFVFLMRGADVPARVVTGYQGGERNPIDDTLVVRQSDAHAWAEVWLAEQGWVRVDPTALAAPARIDGGLASALPQAERPLLMRGDMRWLRELRHRWDAVSNAWNQAVLGYDTQRQRRLLQRLGLDEPDWTRITLLLAAALALLMPALFGWSFLQRRSSDRTARAWALFCKKLARAGRPRLPSEGPIDYAHRLMREHPAATDEILAIASAYARLRYGPPTPDRAQAEQRLLQRIRDFKTR